MDVLMRLDPFGSRPGTNATGNVATQRSVGTGESKKRGGTTESSRSANRNGTPGSDILGNRISMKSNTSLSLGNREV